uniref:Uncharacterized protein n=1 Tax=Manihot esculenta TaxID=3983 RepID=A0A2C9UX26_MANES
MGPKRRTMEPDGINRRGEITIMQVREGDPRKKSWAEMVSNRSKKSYYEMSW